MFQNFLPSFDPRTTAHNVAQQFSSWCLKYSAILKSLLKSYIYIRYVKLQHSHGNSCAVFSRWTWQFLESRANSRNGKFIYFQNYSRVCSWYINRNIFLQRRRKSIFFQLSLCSVAIFAWRNHGDQSARKMKRSCCFQRNESTLTRIEKRC